MSIQRRNRLLRPFTTPIARGVAGIGVVALAIALVGWWTTPTLGGLGPALFWLGILAGPAALLVAAVLASLLERHPDLHRPLIAMVKASASALAIVLVVVVGLEICYRGSHPLLPLRLRSLDPLIYLQRPHAELGWSGAPNYSRVMDFLSGPRHFTTNSRGFRDIEQQIDPQRPRVVVIGDSFPLGWGGDVEDSITPRLREALPGLQFFNASWQGYGKDQIAWSYRILARPLRPQVVVMMFMAQPFHDTSRPLYEGLRKPYYRLEGDRLQLIGRPAQALQSAAANRRYHRRWQASRIDGPGSAWHFLTHDLPRDHSAFGHRMLRALECREANRLGLPPLDPVETRILEQLRQQVEADGAQLIVVPAPTPPLFGCSSKPTQAMARYLRSYRQLGIDTLDITPLLHDSWRQCYNRDDHPNAQASERICKPLAARIRQAMARR